MFDDLCPDVVINCAGLTKHKPFSDDPPSIPINTLMPHRLAGLCKLVGARLVHISTDCVFSGTTGAYLESDHTDASDIYSSPRPWERFFILTLLLFVPLLLAMNYKVDMVYWTGSCHRSLTVLVFLGPFSLAYQLSYLR